MTPGLEGRYLSEFQRAMAKKFYGEERLAQIEQEASDKRRIQIERSYIRDIDPSLLGTEERSERLSYLQGKTNLEKNVNEMSIFDNPSLKQMLALSENNHNNLSKHYSTLDDKLPANNHRAFLGSQNGKMLYRA